MKFLIADDHGLNREFLRILLEKIYPRAEIFEAGDYHSAEHQCRQHKPTLVILDVSMPGMRGLLGVLDMIRKFPESNVLICSAVDNPILIGTMLSFGAKGFVSKASASEEFMRGIDCVLKGESYIPDSLSHIPSIRFTARQSEILSMFCSGSSNKEIAKQLDVSIHTVKLHISSILESLGVQNRMQAIALCGLHFVGIS
jgi:DNA-binding NarL/FixJ family response regulator